MRCFQLCEDRRVIVAGKMYVHGLLKALRGNNWSIVGIVQLTEDEWIALTQACMLAGIAVNHEPIPA
jgi:hypothetical protein